MEWVEVEPRFGFLPGTCALSTYIPPLIPLARRLLHFEGPVVISIFI